MKHPVAVRNLQVTGLDKHQLKDSQPLKYTHLDVAGSSGKLPEPTTAASVIGLVMNTVNRK